MVKEIDRCVNDKWNCKRMDIAEADFRWRFYELVVIKRAVIVLLEVDKISSCVLTAILDHCFVKRTSAKEYDVSVQSQYTVHYTGTVS